MRQNVAKEDLALPDVNKSYMEIISIYNKFKECGRVTTDTRTLSAGDMFFALRGENHDGNEYALQALENGARYAVVSADSAAALSDDSRIIRVNDTLKTLQELARWHRSMTFVDGKPLPVIALTGTNGKTTTKELIREVLAVKYSVTATKGNLNNSIGVPLTLLSVNDSTQIAVVEMGASHPGDIKELVDIALPDFGLITNVGKAHLLGFGSFEGVMNTKGELYDYLRRTSDKVFLNVDNPYLCRMASERNLQSDPERPYSLVIPYGVGYSGAEILPSSSEFPFLRIRIGSAVVQTNLVGSYNADNVMAAMAVGMYFGVSFDECVDAISSYCPSNNRSQMVRTSANTIIVDAYNANPTSMEAALNNFAVVQADHKVALLGDMLELGADSAAEHEKIVKVLQASDINLVCLVGKEFRMALDRVGDKEIKWFETSAHLADWIKENPVSGASVLIKGSRGTRMEKTLDVL